MQIPFTITKRNVIEHVLTMTVISCFSQELTISFSGMVFTRLSKEAAKKILWKSQSGLQHAHCRADVIFPTRQTQEKCREENEEKSLWCLFSLGFL